MATKKLNGEYLRVPWTVCAQASWVVDFIRKAKLLAAASEVLRAWNEEKVFPGDC